MRFSSLSAGRLAFAAFLLAGPALAQDAGPGGSGDYGKLPVFVEPEAVPQYEAGVKALREKRYKDARLAFTMVLRSIEDDARLLVLTGLAYSGEGNQAAAARYFKAAIRSDETYVPAYQELGILQAELGDKEQARKQLAELNRMAASCRDTCAKAAELKTAISELNSAIGA